MADDDDFIDEDCTDDDDLSDDACKDDKLAELLACDADDSTGAEELLPPPQAQTTSIVVRIKTELISFIIIFAFFIGTFTQAVHRIANAAL